MNKSIQARDLTKQAPHNPRILVVEDDTNICETHSGVLVRSGHRGDTAGDGANGWRALDAASYDRLITDNSMPKLSGVELVQETYEQT